MNLANYSGILLILCFACILGCDDAKQAAQETGDETKQAMNEIVDETQRQGEKVSDSVKEAAEDLVAKVPQFKNKLLQEYVESYEDYLNEYAEIVKGKDMMKFAKLVPKGQKLAKQAVELTKEITPEESKRLTEYLTAKAKKLQELAQELGKQ